MPKKCEYRSDKDRYGPFPLGNRVGVDQSSHSVRFFPVRFVFFRFGSVRFCNFEISVFFRFFSVCPVLGFIHKFRVIILDSKNRVSIIKMMVSAERNAEKNRLKKLIKDRKVTLITNTKSSTGWNHFKLIKDNETGQMLPQMYAPSCKTLYYYGKDSSIGTASPLSCFFVFFGFGFFGSFFFGFGSVRFCHFQTE